MLCEELWGKEPHANTVESEEANTHTSSTPEPFERAGARQLFTGLDCVTRCQERSLLQVTSNRFAAAAVSQQLAIHYLQNTKGLVCVQKTSYLKTSQEFKNTNITQDIAVGDITNVTLQTVHLLSYLRELLLALPRCADHRDFQKKNEMSSQHPFSL